MNSTYLEENKKAIYRIVEEMTDGFKSHKKTFLPKERTTAKEDVVVTKERHRRAPRYGVLLQQEGENYVYKYIRVIKQIIKQTYSLEDSMAEREATNIMCEYVLKQVYENCGYEFKTRYDEVVTSEDRSGRIKLFGILLLLILLVITGVGILIYGK